MLTYLKPNSVAKQFVLDQSTHPFRSPNAFHREKTWQHNPQHTCYYNPYEYTVHSHTCTGHTCTPAVLLVHPSIINHRQHPTTFRRFSRYSFGSTYTSYHPDAIRELAASVSRSNSARFCSGTLLWRASCCLSREVPGGGAVGCCWDSGTAPKRFSPSRTVSPGVEKSEGGLPGKLNIVSQPRIVGIVQHR